MNAGKSVESLRVIYLAQLCLVFDRITKNGNVPMLSTQCSNHDSLGHPGRVYVSKMAIRKGLELIYIKLIY